MNLYNKDFIFANRTSSSFYSNLSFNKKITETHFPSFSTSLNSRKNFKIPKKNKREIDLYHRNYLKEQLLNNKNLSRNVFITKHNLNSYTFENNYYSYSLNNHQFSSGSFLPILTESEEFSNRKKPKIDNLSNFLNKIKILTKTKFLIKHKKILTENLMNNEFSKIQENNMLIFEKKYAKNMFNIYLSLFKNYLNFLKKKYEEFLDEFRKIIRNENIIRMNVKALKLRKEDLQQKLNEFKNYQYFLLKVKYKVLNLKDLPDFILKKIGLSHLIVEKNERIKKKKTKNRFSLINLKRKSSIFSVKKSKIIKQKSLDSNSLINSSNKQNGSYFTIYNNIDEFNQDINYIQNKLFDNFTKYNNIKQEIEKLKEEKEKLFVENKINKEFLFNENELVNKLNFLKKQNFDLKKKLSILGSIQTVSYQYFKIYQKLSDIIFNLPINIEKEFDVKNLYKHLENKDENILYKGYNMKIILLCLFLIEKILDKNLQKFNSNKKDIKTSLLIKDIKYSLENKKRIKQNHLKMENEKKRREKMNLEIIKKMNLTLFIPKRKVNISYQKFNNKTKFYNKKINNEYKLTIDQIINY